MLMRASAHMTVAAVLGLLAMAGTLGVDARSAEGRDPSVVARAAIAEPWGATPRDTVAATSYIGIHLGIQVKEVLCADPRVEGTTVHAIRVEVEDTGVVTLHGTTSTAAARRAAEEAARSVRGVQNVQNLLVVDPSTLGADPRDDRRVAMDVETALDRDPRLRAGRVGLMVEEGLVTLAGTVPNVTARLVASEIARGVPGVRAVQNNLSALDLGLAPPPRSGGRRPWSR